MGFDLGQILPALVTGATTQAIVFPSVSRSMARQDKPMVVRRK